MSLPEVRETRKRIESCQRKDIERGCFNCGKTRGKDCDKKREQHEYCRPWIPQTVSSNQSGGS